MQVYKDKSTIYDHADEYQGKRTDQVVFSKGVTFVLILSALATIGLMALTMILFIILTQ